MLAKAAESTVVLKPSYKELKALALTPEAEKALESQVLAPGTQAVTWAPMEAVPTPLTCLC